MAKIPDNKVDFNKLRKRRQRATTFKRMFMLGGILLLIFGAIFLNNILVEESVTTRISDLVQGLGGTGYPVAVPGGVIRSVQTTGGDLAVLNDTNLYIYNNKGKQIGNFQKKTDSTVLHATASRYLTYDSNSTGFTVNSRSKVLYEADTEYNIFAADMNEHGDFAIVNSAKRAICGLTVYNSKFKDIYAYSFTTNLVSSVSVSPRGDMLVAGWVNAEKGMLQSGVEIHLFAEQTGVIASALLADNLILDVKFQEQDRIQVLTDRQYIIMGADGAIRQSYDFGSWRPSMVKYSGRLTAIMLEDPSSTARELILLDSELEPKSSIKVGGRITDIALTSKRIYVAGEQGITTYDHSFSEIDFDEIQNVQYLQMVGSKLHYLTREQICVLGQVEEEENAETSESYDEMDDISEPDADDSQAGEQ